MLLYLLPLVGITVSSSVILLLIILFTAPETVEGTKLPINIVYFFISAFLSLAGFLTLVLYFVRSLRLKKTRGEIGLVHKPKLIFWLSLRQGVLAATALIGIALLNALDFSNPLNIILLISAVVLIEIYFFSH